MTMTRLTLMLGLVGYCSMTFSAGAATFSAPPSEKLITSGTAEVILDDDYRFHVLKDQYAYTVTLVESEEGVVVVDTGSGRNPEFGKNIDAYLAAIGKPASLLITHAHADHFGNVNRLEQIEFIYAGKNVARTLSKEQKFTKLTDKKVVPVENRISLYGIDYKFHNVRQAEAEDNGFITIDSAKALFVGDLLYVDAYNYIREYTPNDEVDEITNWITAINKFKYCYQDYSYVFVGHNGYSTQVEQLVNDNIEYLSTAQGLIKGIKPLSNHKKAQSVEDVVTEMKRLFPGRAGRGLDLSLPGSFSKDDPGANWFE